MLYLYQAPCIASPSFYLCLWTVLGCLVFFRRLIKFFSASILTLCAASRCCACLVGQPCLLLCIIFVPITWRYSSDSSNYLIPLPWCSENAAPHTRPSVDGQHQSRILPVFTASHFATCHLQDTTAWSCRDHPSPKKERMKIEVSRRRRTSIEGDRSVVCPGVSGKTLQASNHTVNCRTPLEFLRGGREFFLGSAPQLTNLRLQYLSSSLYDRRTICPVHSPRR